MGSPSRVSMFKYTKNTNAASSFYKLNNRKSKPVVFGNNDDMKTDDGVHVTPKAVKHIIVDYNPKNCTLSSNIFDSLSYKNALIEELKWRKENSRISMMND